MESGRSGSKREEKREMLSLDRRRENVLESSPMAAREGIPKGFVDPAVGHPDRSPLSFSVGRTRDGAPPTKARHTRGESFRNRIAITGGLENSARGRGTAGNERESRLRKRNSVSPAAARGAPIQLSTLSPAIAKLEVKSVSLPIPRFSVPKGKGTYGKLIQPTLQKLCFVIPTNNLGSSRLSI